MNTKEREKKATKGKSNLKKALVIQYGNKRKGRDKKLSPNVGTSVSITTVLSKEMNQKARG